MRSKRLLVDFDSISDGLIAAGAYSFRTIHQALKNSAVAQSYAGTQGFDVALTLGGQMLERGGELLHRVGCLVKRPGALSREFVFMGIGAGQ